jgi:hypothetical protein
MGSTVTQIIHMVMVAVIDAQCVQSDDCRDEHDSFFTRQSEKG